MMKEESVNQETYIRQTIFQKWWNFQVKNSRESIASRPTLQEMLKEVFPTESEWSHTVIWIHKKEIKNKQNKQKNMA